MKNVLLITLSILIKKSIFYQYLKLIIDKLCDF